MSTSKYFLIFYNSDKPDVIEQINNYLHENFKPIHPENTKYIPTGQSNIFFLQVDESNSINESELFKFYVKVMVHKNGSIQNILTKCFFYITEVKSITSYL